MVDVLVIKWAHGRVSTVCVLGVWPFAVWKWSDSLSPGTLTEQGKGPEMLILSSGFRVRTKVGQIEPCPKILSFREEKLFKEGQTSAFLEHVSPISCLLPHRQAGTQASLADTCSDEQASLVEIKVCQDSGSQPIACTSQLTQRG